MTGNKPLRGIDISEHQYAKGAEIDWDKVAPQIDFAMIRTGFANTRDQRVDTAIVGASAARIPVGVYHYSHAKNEAEARSEAALVLDVIRPYKISWPVVIDMEDPDVLALGREVDTAVCLAFCEEIAKAGYQPMLYTTCYWLNNTIDKYRVGCAGIPLWISWPKKNCTWDTLPEDGLTKHHHTMWQFCTTAHIDGIVPKVDLDISYFDYGRLKA